MSALIASWLATAALAAAPTAPPDEGAPAALPPDRAARDEAPGNALVFEPLAVVFAKTIAVEYERRLTDGVSLALAPALAYGDVRGSGESPVTGSYLALGATLAVRFYPWSVAPEGAFIGPYGGVSWGSADAGDASASGLGWSVGGLAGYTWILGRFFVISGGLGASWNDLAVDASGTTTASRGVALATRLAIGGVF